MGYSPGCLTAYSTVKKRGIKDPVYTLTALRFPVKEKGYEISDRKKASRNAFEASLSESLLSDTVMEDDSDSQKADKRFNESLVRARSNVIQLGANNPWEYFVTLSFRRDREDFSAYDLCSVKKKVLKFFYNYAQRSGSKSCFKFLLIPEKHKDGAWHFHGLMSGINENDLFINKNGYLDFRPYAERFGHISFGLRQRKGTNKCQMGRIRDLNKTSTYIAKYISKTMFGDVGFQKGMHLYYASRGLNRDALITRGRFIGTPDFVNANVGFENEFCFKIFSDSPDALVDKVIPYENRFKLGYNIPSTANASKVFIERYGKLSSLLGVKISESDFKTRNSKYDAFVMRLNCSGLDEYIPNQGVIAARANILGISDAPLSCSDIDREIPITRFDELPDFTVGSSLRPYNFLLPDDSPQAEQLEFYTGNLAELVGYRSGVNILRPVPKGGDNLDT